jgi:hypothetical protein
LHEILKKKNILYEKKIKITVFLFLMCFIFQSCEHSEDVELSQDLQITNFIWNGMNQFYLYKDEVPNLTDNHFANQESKNSFLSQYSSPNDLFESLLYKDKDRFSWLVDDYVSLEQGFAGVSKSNGVYFKLVKISGSGKVFGYVCYIIPNSNASKKRY